MMIHLMLYGFCKPHFKKIENKRRKICLYVWGGEVILGLICSIYTHSATRAKMSSIKIADYVVNSERLNTSICPTCHFFGTVPHFNFGLHTDAHVNPLHGSINTDYETIFYPVDAKTKHSRINAILQIVSQAGSGYFMFRIRRLLLFITEQHMYNSCSIPYGEGESEPRKLDDLYFSTANPF